MAYPPVPAYGTPAGPPIAEPAAAIAPQMLPYVYDNPFLAISAAFPGDDGSLAFPRTSPRYQALRDIGIDPLVLYMASMGDELPVGEQPGADAFYNWLVGLYRQLGTPGGQHVQAPDLIRRIFGAKMDETTEGGLSALGAMLLAGDASTQLRTLFNMLRDVTNAGMNPLAARAYQAALARAADEALDQIIHGRTDETNVVEWIKKNAPSLVPSG